MPYIGNVPAEAYSQVSYQDLTGGSGTSFTLDYPVGSAGEIEVFVNNVRQEPTVAYTVNGTALTMTGSIVATDDFYIVFQGKAEKSGTIPEKQANGTYVFPDDVTVSGNITSTGVDITGTLTSAGLTVDTNTLYVDSANNRVGIGTSSPTGKLSVSDPTYLSSTATLGSSITLNSENTASWLGTRELISFESVGNGADHRTGTLSIKLKKGNSDTTLTEYMQINAVSNYTTFSTAGSEAMRLDASGNLLVGKTTTAFGTQGIRLEGSNGKIELTRNNNVAFAINRLTSDGDLMHFYKDGTTVGSIGSSGDDLTVGNDVTTVKFHNGLNTIHPNGTGSGSDGFTTLGWTNNRFKDLYLSGGVYLGGVGSSNKLDDYEESSFGLTTASDATGSLDANSYGYYVKVGSMVTVQIVFQCTANFTSNKIGDLPFVPINHSTVISTLHGGGVVFYGGSRGFVRVSNNDTKMYFTDTSGAAVNPSTTNDPFRFTITYRTS